MLAPEWHLILDAAAVNQRQQKREEASIEGLLNRLDRVAAFLRLCALQGRERGLVAGHAARDG